MKSFKKLFALVLVVAMFASFGIGATAAFTDAADIDNTAAVQLISDLGVMTGYPDGSFKPDGNITRAEMAKIIVALKYGAASANALQGTYTVTGFTDVKPDFWAAAYIGICKNTGVINGVTPTTFNPAGNVKTVDAVKMILATLGYGKANEYVGATYTTAVLLDGLNAGILTGDENLNAFATRDQIAAFVKTAIYATLQTYDKDSGTYSPVTDNTKDTIGEKTFGLGSKTGVVVGNASYDLVDGIVNLADQSATKVWVDDGDNAIESGEVFAYNFVSDASLIGENITVYFKNAPSLANVYPNYGYTKLTKTVAHSTTTGATYGAPFFANGYTVNADTRYFLNGVASTQALTVTAYASKNGTLLKYIDIDADNAAELVLCETSALETVAYIASNGKITTGLGHGFVNTAATASAGAVVVESGLTTADYAVIQTISGVTTVKKALVATGKITGTSGSGAATVYTVAGTGYKLTDGSGVTFTATNYTADFNYYLNAQGYIAAAKQVTASVASGSYAVILESAVVNGSDTSLDKVIRLQLLFLSGEKAGTTAVVTAANIGNVYASTTDAATTIDGYEKDMIFSYTVNSTTGAYSLTDASATAVTTSSVDITTKANFASGLYSNNATVFVVRTGNAAVGYTYTAYTGYATLPAMDDAKITYIANNLNVVSAAFIYDATSATSATKYLYITNSVPNYYYNNGLPYYTYSAIVDGAPAAEIKVDSSINPAIGTDGLWGTTDDVNPFGTVGLYAVTYLNGAVKTATAVGFTVTTTAAHGLEGFDAASGTMYAKYWDATLVTPAYETKYYTYTGTETVYLFNTATKTVTLSTVEDVAALVLTTNAANTVNNNKTGVVNITVATNIGSTTALNTMYVSYTAPAPTPVGP